MLAVNKSLPSKIIKLINKKRFRKAKNHILLQILFQLKNFFIFTKQIKTFTFTSKIK